MSTASADRFLAFNTLECIDRLVITGTSMSFGWESAMRTYCYKHGIDKMYLADWARPITERIREWAIGAACVSGEDMVDCNRFKGRKDEMVKAAVANGDIECGKPILVFKSMENCFSFYRSQSALTAKTKGSPFHLRSSKCLHFYVYFIDDILGLVCLRIQSYAPFAIQIIVNGHNILERMMIKEGLKYTKVDNCFTWLENHQRAQELANRITGPFINDRITEISKQSIPLNDIMPEWYRFTVRQIEYSTDIYTPTSDSGIQRTANTIMQLCLQRPDDFITYLIDARRTPKKPEFSYRNTHLGICAKFHAGTSSIKAYHKCDALLRTETSCFNLRKLRCMRTMHNKAGEKIVKMAPMTRSLEDIGLFIDFGRNANNRMRERLSCIWERSYSNTRLQSIAQATKNQKINFSGINFFAPRDESILQAAGSAQHDLSGFKRQDIANLANISPGQASYALRRLRAHKLIKKGKGTNRYHLTKGGRSAVITSKTLQALVACPIMAA